MSLSGQVYRDSVCSYTQDVLPATRLDSTAVDALPLEVDGAMALAQRVAQTPLIQAQAIHSPSGQPTDKLGNSPILGTSIVSTLSDYLELTKPKIAVLELITVTAAAAVAGLEFLALIHVLIGTALVAASASAANQWIESDLDRDMARTVNRPLAAGRLGGRSVMWFIVFCLVSGVGYLAATLQPLTALLGLISWVLYVLVYTPMKTRTPANTLVGAVAGAIPALMGYTAMGGSLDMRAMSLFLILFLWQFPHFMAIAWLYRHEYRRAGMQMLTVVDPSGTRAGAQALLAALALAPVSLVPIVQPLVGHVVVYFLWAMLLGLGYLLASVVFLIRRNDTTARWLLRASLVYLPGLLGLLTMATPR